MSARTNSTNVGTPVGFILAGLLAFAAGVAPAAGQGISFVQPIATPLVTHMNGSGVVGLAAGDFDGDGNADLAVTLFEGFAGSRGFVAVMHGKGDGTFEAPITLLSLPPDVVPLGILAKDFRGVGTLDLAVAVPATRQILYFKNMSTPGTITFAAPVATNTTHHPQGLQTADLNGDAILDLVTLNPDDNSVSVLLGNGDGSFQAPVNYAVGANPLDVAIGDVDGISGPDLVVANQGPGTISVLLNNGHGSFGAAANFNARVQAQGLYLADFDGDGILDVVAAGAGCGSGAVDFLGCMVFMKGRGDGSFAVPSDQNFTGLDSIPIRRFTENIAPDLNGDGIPDVLFVPLEGGGFGKSDVAVGLNTGDGTGTFRVTHWVGGSTQAASTINPDNVQGLAAVVADLNNDGVLDVVYATQGKESTVGALTILLGATPGTFQVPRSYSTFAKNFGNDGGSTQRGGAFGSFTSTGTLGLAVLISAGCPSDGPLLATFLSNGDGSLSDPIAATQNPACHGGDSTLRSVSLANNGASDLLFLGFQGNFTNEGVVASANGNGTFTLTSSFPIGASQLGLNMVVGDFNGDGFPDVAVYEEDDTTGCFPTRNIEIFLQGAGGTKTFAPKSILPVSPIGVCVASQFSGMVAADFDHDGKVDLIAQVAVVGGANVLFFKGNGDGTFAAPIVISMGLPEIVDFAAADVNNDGNVDLVGIGGGAVFVQLGNGDGTFQAPVSYAFGGSCIDSSNCVVKVVDFDLDGNPDIALASRDSFAGFAVLRGKGDGTFQPAVKFAVGATGTNWLDIADVNGDGLPDVVIGHSGENGNNYTVLINNSPPPGPATIRNPTSPR